MGGSYNKEKKHTSIQILARSLVMKNLATLFGVNLYRAIREILENVSPLSNIQFQDHTFCVIISNARQPFPLILSPGCCQTNHLQAGLL